MNKLEIINAIINTRYYLSDTITIDPEDLAVALLGAIGMDSFEDLLDEMKRIKGVSHA